MPLMATKTKLSKPITSFTTKTPILRFGFCSNGVNGPILLHGGGVGRVSYSTSAMAQPESVVVGSRHIGLEMLGVKDYEDYRRSLYGEITHKAGLLTMLAPLLFLLNQWLRQIGEKYGVEYSEAEILNRYRRAYEQPWGRSRLRYVNYGRPFWQYIVSSSTGCSDSQNFEELYNYYTTDKAWHLCDPDAEKVFEALRKSGVKVAVVSNFDTRLRPLLQVLSWEHWFDAVAASAEVAQRVGVKV